MSKILVRDHPTSGEMDIIEKVNGMMLSFHFVPDEVKDYATSRAFQVGWLAGLGLKPSHRLALILVPKGLDMEQVKTAYIENLEKAATPISFVIKNLQGLKNE